MSTAKRLLDRLDEVKLRDRLRRIEEERVALIALLRACRVRDRGRPARKGRKRHAA